MAVTIKDVAKYAGCSIKTVSRVINNEPYVTEELRTQVQAAIRAVGYVPNLSARRLVQHKAYMLGILMYPGYSQATSAVLSRIMDIGYEENYDILIQPYFPAHARSRDKLANLITGHRLDGFVSTPPCDTDGFIVDLLTTFKVPLVQINPFTRSEAIPYIAGDDYQGAFAATEHLIGLGHRVIGFLLGPRNLRASVDRLYGYRAALDAHRITADEHWLEDSEFTFDGGYTATKLLMERRERPTAIFAGSDESALGVLFAAQEMGLRVPDDLSVCGYDDFLLSKNIWPGLTTVHQPSEEMLEQATRLLIKLVNGEPVEEKQVVIAPRLIVRGSTGPGTGKN
jgi:LacI family transcriptional regulator